MDLNNLRFVISDKGDLTEKERIFLYNEYRNLFNVIYGIDILENIVEKLDKTKISKNRKKALSSLTDIEAKEDLSLILIYYEDELIGGGRIKKIEDKVASIPDIAIGVGTNTERYDIWKQTVAYIEEYLTSLNYEKMYIEIPVKTPYLLYRAEDLGFREDPEDIVVSSTVKTYLYNKKLERIKDEKSNHHR